jgi:hypothetical protein
MSTEAKKADAKSPFGTVGTMPASAQDCGMEEAANWGLLREPRHAGQEPQKGQTPETPRPF